METCITTPTFPPDFERFLFKVVAGESVPLLLTVTIDGNGAAIDSIDAYDVEVYVKDAKDRHASLALSRSSVTGGVIVSGATAGWTWTPTEVSNFPRLTAFYVRLIDADGVAAFVAMGVLNIFKP